MDFQYYFDLILAPALVPVLAFGSMFADVRRLTVARGCSFLCTACNVLDSAEWIWILREIDIFCP
jgi:hypothetical protein